MLQGEKARIPKYKIIETELLSQIKSGKVTVGQKVPTEHALSEKFEVSRLTARKALSNLENLGYLERMPGKGTYVKDWLEGVRHSSMKLKNNIAMVTIDETPLSANPESWDMHLLRAATYEAEKLGFHVTLCGATTEQIAQGELPLALREKTACAAMLDGWVNDTVVRGMIGSGVPFLLAGNHENSFNVPEVSQDMEDAGYKITREMLALNRGPVWLIDVEYAQSYQPGIMFKKGYSRAVLDNADPDRLVHLYECRPDDCRQIIQYIAKSAQKQHCFIFLHTGHFNSFMRLAEAAHLDIDNFIFANVGRYREGWHDKYKDRLMLCEIEPSMVAREAVRQIVASCHDSQQLATKRFKLDVERNPDPAKPFTFSWK